MCDPRLRPSRYRWENDLREKGEEAVEVEELLAKLERAESERRSIKDWDATCKFAFKSCSENASCVLQKAALAHSSTLLMRSTLRDVMCDNKRRVHGCVMLFFTLVLFSASTASTILHEEITQGHLLESPLRDALALPLAEVDSIRDVWRWFDQVLVPTFFQQTDTYGGPAPKSEWSRVFVYSRLQGAVMLQQSRSERRPCSDELVSHLTCYPQRAPSSEAFGRPLSALPGGFNRSVLSSDDEGFVAAGGGRRLRAMREEIMPWLPKGAEEGATFTFFLHRGSPLEEIRQRLAYLRARRWLDEQTTQLVVRALVLNTEMREPQMESVEVTFAFSRGGGIFGRVYLQALIMTPWNGPFSLLTDAVFCLLLLVFTVWEIAGLANAARKGAAWKHMLNLTHVLAWMNLVVAWVYVALFLLRDSLRRPAVEKLEELNSPAAWQGAGAGPDRGWQEEAGEEVHGALRSLFVCTAWCNSFSTFVVVLLMFRCFLGLAFQPRLAVVVDTLKATSIDLLHFLIIIVPTFGAFAVVGMCIFGRRVDEFSSLERAIGTCFKIAIESEYQWDKLSAEDFWTAATWVISFVTLIVLIMLNMVLAIIMDVYTEVRSRGDSQETIWESIRWFLYRVRYFRQWVPTGAMLARLEEPDFPEIFTAEELQEAFPGMPLEQLEHVLQKSRRKLRTGLSELDDNLPAKMLAAMQVGLDLSRKALAVLELRKGGEEGQRRNVDEACYEDIIQSIAVQNHWMMNVQAQLEAIRADERERAAAAQRAVIAQASRDKPGYEAFLRHLQKRIFRQWKLGVEAGKFNSETEEVVNTPLS